eukprot:g1434.t1
MATNAIKENWGAFRPKTATQLARLETLRKLGASNRQTPSSNDSSLVSSDESSNKSASETSRFFSWLSRLEAASSVEKVKPAERVCKELSVYETSCNDLLHAIDQSLGFLDEMENQQRSATSKTSNLIERCQGLVKEQKRLEEIVEKVEIPMSYFNELLRIGPLFGLPLSVGNQNVQLNYSFNTEEERENETHGGNVSEGQKKNTVLEPGSPQFLKECKRIEECIDFLSKHSQFRDAATFKLRFQQLLRKAMTMAKNAVCEALVATTTKLLGKPAANAEAVAAMTDAQLSSQLHMLQIEFRSRTKIGQLQLLVSEIENRADEPVYKSLLVDVHRCYYEQRMRLLSKTVPLRLNQLQKRFWAEKRQKDIVSNEEFSEEKEGNLAQFARESFDVLVSILMSEQQLFAELFSLSSAERAALFARAVRMSSSNETLVEKRRKFENSLLQQLDENCILINMTKELCGSLHSNIRQRIMQQHELNEISDLLEVLNFFQSKMKKGENSHAEFSENSKNENLVIFSSFDPVMSRMITDAKERLKYCAENFIHEKIETFSPNFVALEQEIAQQRQRRQQQQQQQQQLNGEMLMMNQNDDIFFSTVRNTISILNIHHYIDAKSFSALAYRALLATIESIKKSSILIEQNSSSHGTLDALLFSIQQLLTLREQISPFSDTTFAFTETSLDISAMTSHLVSAIGGGGQNIERKESENTSGWFSNFFGGIPTQKQETKDSKKILETQLKESCSAFIEKAKTYVDNDSSLLSFGKNNEEKQQFLASLRQFSSHFTNNIKVLNEKMELYLLSHETKKVLLESVFNCFLAVIEDNDSFPFTEPEKEEIEKIRKNLQNFNE